MITFIEPLPIGNAIRVLLSPPLGTEKTRVLRKTTDNISGPTDPDAGVVYEGSETSFVDTNTLVNGVAYYYQAFDYSDAVTFTTSPSASGTPSTSYGVFGPDALDLVRDRLAAGLKSAVAAKVLTHANGAIPCLTAPPLFEMTVWPVVTIHLQSESPEIRALGELVTPDIYDVETAEWESSEGWLARVQLQIISWALNPDDRIAIRKAIRSILIGNLSVFDAAGIINVEISQTDIEDFDSHSAALYQTITNFSCIAPSIVQDTSSFVIADVTVGATV